VEQTAGGVRYRSTRTAGDRRDAEFAAVYRPAGPVFHPRAGSLEYFLTERYCLYTVADEAHPRRVEIHHRRWPLQIAEARIDTETMMEAAGIQVERAAPLLHYAKRQDVVAWASTPAF
ncbi:MAG: hypothetical protein JWL71_133, partial [Acidobacteria bacterium]|nr:hypothetical protein [Acidobacteriota bacterium]